MSIPELPEVMTVVKQLNQEFAKGSSILTSAWPADNHTKIFKKGAVSDLFEVDDESEPQFMPDPLILDSVTNVGKYIVFNFRSEKRSIKLIVHLLFTGRFTTTPLTDKDGGGEYRHRRLTLGLLDRKTGKDKFLYLYDKRRFARAYVTFEEKPKILSNIGPDILNAAPGEWKRRCLDALSNGSKRTIKNLVLDQSVISGVGNIYVCEALHIARIHPKTPAYLVMKDSQAGEDLHKALRFVIREGLAHGGCSISDFYDLNGKKGTEQMNLQVFKKAKSPCANIGAVIGTRCAGIIVRIPQDGRGSYLCPRCQALSRFQVVSR